MDYCEFICTETNHYWYSRMFDILYDSQDFRNLLEHFPMLLMGNEL